MPDEATQDQLKFVEVDLTELMNEGVLMAANERFFWPFGLALTWNVSTSPVNEYIWCRNERVHDAHTWDAPLGHLSRCEGTKLGDTATGLHVRQWTHPDDQQERIDLDPGDEVGAQRRQAFAAWATKRIESMIPAERVYAKRVLRRL